MKTEKEIIDNTEIWFTCDECYNSESNEFLGYMSFFSTEKPGLLLGEATKNHELKIVLFDNERKALNGAIEFYKKYKK